MERSGYTRGLQLVTGMLGASGVVLGAFGAHALRDRLEPALASAWETAVTYHLLHAVALIGVALWHQHRPDAALRVAGACFLFGILLFSGSLYLLALGAPRWLGPVTPVGGVLFVVGWIALAATARRAG